MKTKFLFSTLAMAAAFSACTQEEVVMSNETAGDLDGVAGAVLLGNGISVVSGEAVESRIAIKDGNAVFTKGDKAAVAWAVNASGKVTDKQKYENLNGLSPSLYANHMLVHDGNAFESRGNIYEGWHFAYRPFVYMNKPQQLVLGVNDRALTETDLDIDKYENAPMFSNALFLDDSNVVAEEGRVTAKMDMRFAVNSLRPWLYISQDFTGHEDLDDIKITGITLKSGSHKLFTDSIKVQPKYLSDMTAVDEDGELVSPFIGDSYFGSNKAFAPATDLKAEVSTVIDNKEAYNTGEELVKTRIFLAPTQDATSVTLSDLSFRIDVAGGHFDVVYTNPEGLEEGAELTEGEEKNNQAIQKLLYWLKGTEDATLNVGARNLQNLWADYENDAQNPNCKLEMALGLENFTADYLVEDIDDWDGCVTLANALCQEGEVPTFTLKEGAEVEFTGEIKAPTNGVNVKGTGKLVVADNLTWNDDVVVARTEQGISVEVAEGAVLNVVDATLAPYRLYNKGTILADATSTIGANGYNSLYTNNRIVIEYGAYVYPRTDNEGTIAYVVPTTDYYNKVATLVSTNNKAGQANVNTLIINEGVTLNCVKSTQTGGSDAVIDRYNPQDAVGSTTTSESLDLSSVALEINGGTITTSEDKKVTVTNVEMNGGSIENVKISGTLTAEGENTVVTKSIEGDVTVSAGETTITGAALKNVTVEAGAKLTLNNCALEETLVNSGTVTIDGENTDIAEIVNNGTLNANTNVTVTTIAINSGSSANVAAGKTIWYTTPLVEGGYIQKGTTTGQILYYGTAQFLADIEAAEAGATVTLNADVVLSEALVIEKEITIDLNGKKISNEEDIYDDNPGDVWSLISVRGANTVVTIKGNGKVKAKEDDCFAVDVRDGGKVIIEDGEFVGNITAVYVHTGSAEIRGGSYSIQQTCGVSGHDGYDETLNCKNENYSNGTASITVTGGSFYKFNPIQEDSTEDSYLAEGYKSESKAGGDWYNVVKK